MTGPWHVLWEIEGIDADNPHEAAETVLASLRGHDSHATCFTVTSDDGLVFDVDLLTGTVIKTNA